MNYFNVGRCNLWIKEKIRYHRATITTSLNDLLDDSYDFDGVPELDAHDAAEVLLAQEGQGGAVNAVDAECLEGKNNELKLSENTLKCES